MRRNQHHSWTKGRAAFDYAFEQYTNLRIGRVEKVGEGLYRTAFKTWIELDDCTEKSGAYMALVAKDDSDQRLLEQFKREAHLLAKLKGHPLPFNTSEPVAVVNEPGILAIVQSACDGFKLEMRAGREPRVKPWEVIGQVAAAIHVLPKADFEDCLIGPPSRRAYGEAFLAATFKDSTEPVISAAIAWAREHLPPVTESVVIHGDLLGQNILLTSENGLSVIDWQFCCFGDPAYELSIITRAARKPFQVGGGLQRLLDAYHALGGISLSANEVHFYEICLIAGWYFDAVNEGMPGSGKAQAELNRLRGVLARVE